MSRALRSGREYDTNQEYVPKPRKRKSTGFDGESAVVKKSGALTFGSLPPSEHIPDIPLVALGSGKRRGYALDAGATSKLSPALYQTMYNRPPPIRAPKKLLTAPAREARPTTVASSGEATPPGVKAAECALGSAQDCDPRAADRAPAASNAPSTPLVRAVGGATSVGAVT